MPCDYKQYPLDWFSRIRPAILARAGHCCEECGLANYTVIRCRDHKALRMCRSYAEAQAWRALHSQRLHVIGYAYRLATIVLAIAPLDHEMPRYDFSNLRALCQACHNRHDAPVRLTKRMATMAAAFEYVSPPLPLYPLKRRDVMESMRNHPSIAPLIDPKS